MKTREEETVVRRWGWGRARGFEASFQSRVSSLRCAAGCERGQAACTAGGAALGPPVRGLFCHSRPSGPWIPLERPLGQPDTRALPCPLAEEPQMWACPFNVSGEASPLGWPLPEPITDPRN